MCIRDRTLDLSLLAATSHSPSISNISNASHGSLSSLNGTTINYTPNADFHGNDSFTALIDGTISVVTLTVHPSADSLKAKSRSLTTDEDQSITVDLADAVENPDGNEVSFFDVTAEHGQLILQSGSQYQYVPPADFNGVDQLYFHAFSPHQAAINSSIPVTVEAVNDPPTVSTYSYSTYEKFFIRLTDLVSDVDSNSIQFRINQTAQLGTSKLNNNDLWYTPSAQVGDDSVVLTASDGEHDRQFTIHIRATTLPVEPSHDGVNGTINTLAELRWLSLNKTAWNMQWQLGRDIDATDTQLWHLSNHDGIDSTAKVAQGFGQIGYGKSSFKGTFDGNGYTISNLYIYREFDKGVGIFGKTDGATIRNLKLTQLNVHGLNNVGGIVGTAVDTMFEQIELQGAVRGTQRIGAIIGDGKRSSIQNSTIQLDGYGLNYLGGLIGYHDDSITENDQNDAVIRDNKLTVNLSGTRNIGGLSGYSKNSHISHNRIDATIDGKYYLGGLIGYSLSTTEANALNIHLGGESYLGGITGYGTNHSVVNSYVIGQLVGQRHVGGIAGIHKHKDSTITNSYSALEITGSSNFGGLFGKNENDAAVSASFFDCDLSGISCSDPYASCLLYTSDAADE